MTIPSAYLAPIELLSCHDAESLQRIKRRKEITFLTMQIHGIGGNYLQQMMIDFIVAGRRQRNQANAMVIK